MSYIVISINLLIPYRQEKKNSLGIDVFRKSHMFSWLTKRESPPLPLKKLHIEPTESGRNSLKRLIMDRRLKIRDILWDFTEEFCKGNIPKVTDYKHIFKNKRKQRILMEDLISAKIAYLIAHPELDLAEENETLPKLFAMLKSLREGR